jgi:hypothetical protein
VCWPVIARITNICMKFAYDNGSGALLGLEFLNADFGEHGESEEG